MAGSLVVDTGRKEKFWISYIRGRIKQNKNFLGILTGPTGSGKSWSALSICQQIDSSFTPSRIVYRADDLMRLINEGNLKTGNCILWDEAGVDLSNRNWQSLINKMVNLLLQTFRHKRLILIMTVPYMDFVDGNTRKLFHAEFLTEKINYENKTVRLKPQLIQYNPRNKKFYYKYLRIKTKLGVSPLKAWNVDKPSGWIIEEYEKKKTKFTRELNIDIENQLKQQKKGGERKELTEKQELCFSSVAKYGTPEEASKHLEISEKTIYFHLAQGRKKGYSVDEFKP